MSHEVPETPARPATPGADARMAWFAAAIVLVVAIASIAPTPVGVFWDDGVYLLSAKALAAGEGYRYSYLPGTPPAIHYPPAWPALLALVLKITPTFPDNVVLLRLINPCMLAIGVAGAARLGAQRLGLGAVAPAAAVAISAMIAPVLVLANVLLSESSFFALLAWSLVVAEGVLAQGGTRRALVLGAMIALLALVRTVGGVLLPAAVLALFWRARRREAAIVFAVTVLLLLPWQLWVWQAARGFPDELRGSYGPYLEWVIGGYRHDPSLLPAVLAKNGAGLWRAFGIIVATRLPAAVQMLGALVVSGLLASGLVSLWRRAPITALFALGYGAVVLAWPYNPERFTWAVWPLAALLLLAGGQQLADWFGQRSALARPVARALVYVVLVGQAAYVVRGVVGGWATSPQRSMAARLWPLVEWTATHAGTRDVIASDGHVMIALYTGRTTMPVSMLTPAEHVREKSVPQFAEEFLALNRAYHPSLLLLSRGTVETDAVASWAPRPDAPRVVPLPPMADGATAYALRAR